MIKKPFNSIKKALSEFDSTTAIIYLVFFFVLLNLLLLYALCSQNTALSFGTIGLISLVLWLIYKIVDNFGSN